MVTSDFSKEWIDFLKGGIYNDKTPFLKFLIVWIAFNSYYSSKYEGGDKKKVLKFAKEKKTLKIYDSIKGKNNEIVKEFEDTVQTKRQSVINTKNTSENYPFNGQKNTCEDFFKVIYQIRCNLIHGGKIPDNKEDLALIKWAFKYLFFFWEEFTK